MLRAAAQLMLSPSEIGDDVGPLSTMPRQTGSVDEIRDEALRLFRRGPIPPGFGVRRDQKRPKSPARLYAALTLAEAIGTEARLKQMLRRAAVSVVSVPLTSHDIEAALMHALCPGWALAERGNEHEDRVRICRDPDKIGATHLAAEDLQLIFLGDLDRLPEIVRALDPLVISNVPPGRDRVRWMIAWCYPRVGSSPTAMAAIERRLPPEEYLRRLSGAQIVAAMRAPTAGGAIRTLARLCAPKGASPDVPPLSSIVGLGAATDLAAQIVKDLQAWSEGTLSWTAICRGLLLSGEPGTGKTLLARAMANQAGISFVSGSYAIWQRDKDGHLGTMLKAMNSTFREAEESAPSVLFIDEIDAFRTRTYRDDHGSSYSEKVTAALLEQLDGVAGREGVVAVAACNHPEQVDPAVIRSGRFDQHIRIGFPTTPELATILRQHLGGDLPDIDLARLAALVPGKTGADCAAALRMARTAARSARRPLHEDDLRMALLGDQSDFPAPLRMRVAVHEVGHFIATVALVLGNPTGIRLSSGQGQFRMTPYPFQPCAPELHALRIKDLAGREAERLILGDVSAGAGGPSDSDLGKVMLWLMREELSLGLGVSGPLWLAAEPAPETFFSLPETIQARIRQMLSAAEQQAQMIHKANRGLIIEMAERLTERFAMGAEELAEYSKRVVMPALPSGLAGVMAGTDD
ncbi:AAA family ATPase [Paracoccus sp. DMF-8]|uniref:AAA family ATPase n=1 Tax=Paracoccus sp. DMF-8 TaxID=3019445 RepID=UPI0023E3E3DE|nr:AAA family ATPase [Paracoccus sp. DMF-8]MDF3608354.1 AAA family ATPase [Paracoccus sp. DMF-8]